jgi:CRP-like cAMP-binding protein
MSEVGSDAAERFLSSQMLAGVDPAVRRQILEALEEESAPAGSVLLEQDVPNDHLSFLAAGTAAVERTALGGKTEAVATLNAPSLFGTTSYYGTSPPTFRIRAVSDVLLLTLHRPAHEWLRREHPLAAEALAVVSLRVLGERFNRVDRLFSDYMASHPDGAPEVTEWAGFRARLFQEPAD